MPLFGVAISQHSYCFHSNNLSVNRSIHSIHNKVVAGDDGGLGLGLASALSWKAYGVTGKLAKSFSTKWVNVWPGGQTIKSVATLELTSDACKNEGVTSTGLRGDMDSVRVSSPVADLQFSSDDVNEEEKLRRMRISRANRGMTPWNKGRKHSAETIQRIKERTKLAMQDPKIRMKMKLINLGNTQTEGTKMKIGLGVRLGWERRRQKLKTQETCHYEWQNLVAEAARNGLLGEEELEWDSYEALNKQLKRGYLRSVKKRKYTPRTKRSKRVPKSPEQKRKISEAISAKWADPEYRNRVFSGLAKYHGISEINGRKHGGDRHVRKRRSARKDGSGNLEKHRTTRQTPRARLSKSKALSFEDPLTNSKLEMIKNIRAQRAAAMNKKNEAISRAKLLIAKAEAAATALEEAGQGSRRIQAALVESRTLIAKANQFLESIEKEDPVPFGNDDDPSVYSLEDEKDPNNQNQNDIKVNGAHNIVEDFRCSEFFLPDSANGSDLDSCHNDLHKNGHAFHQTAQESYCRSNLYDEEDRQKYAQTKNGEGTKMEGKMIKKWIRGRLVEVMEDA